MQVCILKLQTFHNFNFREVLSVTKITPHTRQEFISQWNWGPHNFTSPVCLVCAEKVRYLPEKNEIANRFNDTAQESKLSNV